LQAGDGRGNGTLAAQAVFAIADLGDPAATGGGWWATPARGAGPAASPLRADSILPQDHAHGSWPPSCHASVAKDAVPLPKAVAMLSQQATAGDHADDW